MMKKLLPSAVLIFIVAVGFMLRKTPIRRDTSGAEDMRTNQRTTGDALALSQNAKNNQKRITELESMGELPENARLSDWLLAHQTTWWGKRLDAKTFWSGRPVWLDKSALSAA